MVGVYPVHCRLCSPCPAVQFPDMCACTHYQCKHIVVCAQALIHTLILYTHCRHRPPRWPWDKYRLGLDQPPGGPQRTFLVLVLQHLVRLTAWDHPLLRQVRGDWVAVWVDGYVGAQQDTQAATPSHGSRCYLRVQGQRSVSGLCWDTLPETLLSSGNNPALQW